MARPLPSPEYLRECLDYDEATGGLTWRERPRAHFKKQNDWLGWNRRFAGRRAFAALDKDGYLCGTLCDTRMRTHRVVWAICKDQWPTLEIDHMDGIRDNNRIGNLREATSSQNKRNGSYRANRAGLKGVSVTGLRFTDAKRYQAMIQVNGKQVFLGLYATAEAAHAAYCAAAQKHFGEFARVA